MENNNKIISIVVPFLNEKDNIPLLYNEIVGVFSTLNLYDFELIFVDDGSTDSSINIVHSLYETDNRVKYVQFSRNFGKEVATTAGINESTGDATILMDSDLQHPPELIPEFIKLWNEGNDIVVGIRSKNDGASCVSRIGSYAFNSIMGKISHNKTVRGETDFRLIDRSVADAFNQLPERQRLTRALINWLGFRRACIEFSAPARVNGETKFSVIKLCKLAFSSFISNSLLPLRLAGYIGTFIFFSSGLLGVVVIFEKYIFNDSLGWGVTGTAQLAILNSFLVGIVLMSLGLIALYIEKIHVEVAGRPLYIVRKRSR